MADPTADNVRVAYTGGIYRAPLGTTLPTSAAAARPAAFVNTGYITEDGVTEAQGDTSTPIRAWQGGATVRRVQTEHDLTYAFAFLETNAETVGTFYGNLDEDTARVEIGATQPDHYAWLIEIQDGDGDHIRIVIPDGQITDRGDVTYANGVPIAYGVTLTAYEDPAYAGTRSVPAKAYVYYDTGGLAPAPAP